MFCHDRLCDEDFALDWNAITLGEWVATGCLAVGLAWLSITDIRQYRIPDAASLPLIGLGFVFGLWVGGTAPLDALIGATAGYTVFHALGAVYVGARGEEGLGLGDAKLIAAAGAWLGWRDLPLLIAIAAVSALVFAFATRQRRIAFGPWLAGAFWVLWVVRVSA